MVRLAVIVQPETAKFEVYTLAFLSAQIGLAIIDDGIMESLKIDDGINDILDCEVSFVGKILLLCPWRALQSQYTCERAVEMGVLPLA